MLKIRPAIAEDASALWEAEVETAKTPGRLVSRPNELLLDAFVQKIRELGPRGCYIVAVDGDEVLGHAFLEPMTLAAVQHVYRLTIVVHPGQTGRGVGTALLNHLQRWAAGAPAVGKIELLVRHSNTDAIRLYRQPTHVFSLLNRRSTQTLASWSATSSASSIEPQRSCEQMYSRPLLSTT
jgi:ribosomal protein S18 acetylase RimI-like enzyme